jgi:hypothetical protein
MLENTTKEENLANPFKNDTWFYIKKLDENLATRSTTDNNYN